MLASSASKCVLIVQWWSRSEDLGGMMSIPFGSCRLHGGCGQDGKGQDGRTGETGTNQGKLEGVAFPVPQASHCSCLGLWDFGGTLSDTRGMWITSVQFTYSRKQANSKMKYTEDDGTNLLKHSQHPNMHYIRIKQVSKTLMFTAF